MRYLFSLLILVTITFSGFTQADFRKGYVILNNGDTTRGYIEYKGNKSNARKCVFTKDIGKKSVKTDYTPDEIVAYRFIDSKYYISRKVKSGDIEQNLFLEFLINGKVDVFYYRDGTGEHYLLDRGDGVLIPLTDEERDLYVDGIHYRQGSKKYIGVLKYTFQDAPEITREAEKTSLSHKSLIRITKDYHDAVCKDEVCIIYEKQAPKVIINLGPVAGAGVMFLSKIKNQIPQDYYYFLYTTWPVEFSPCIGLFLNFNLPNLNERTYLQYEATLNYSVTKTTSYYYDPTYPMNYYNDISYTQYMFMNSLFFKYELTAGKIRPVILAGAFVGINFSQSYSRYLKMEIFQGDPFYDEEITENPFKKLVYGINIGAGCIFKVSRKTSISADLHYCTGLGLFPSIITNFITLNVGIPIRLTKN